MSKFSTMVLIVGAGPTGLATAIGLAQQEIDFIIIDALKEAQNTSRAAVVHAATLDSLEALGVAQTMIAQGLKVPRFRVREKDRVLLHVDFGVLESAHPYALMIPQDETEAILVERLRTLGHAVSRPRTFTGLERRGSSFHVEVDGEAGREVIEARYVVGADGTHSAVRDSAAIGFPGKTYGSFLLADVRMDWPTGGNEVALFFSQAGMLVVAPMSEGRFRIVAQDPHAPRVPDVADVQTVIESRGPGPGSRVREVLWGSRFQVHHRLADRFYRDGVLLVGDAAHVHSPAGGQGMNLGLRDAVLLSGALADAIRSGRDARLAEYDVTRRAAAERVLERTDRLTRLATMTRAVSRWGRNQMIRLAGALPFVRRSLAEALAGYS